MCRSSTAPNGYALHFACLSRTISTTNGWPVLRLAVLIAAKMRPLPSLESCFRLTWSFAQPVLQPPTLPPYATSVCQELSGEPSPWTAR
ncbi:MAG: hypothetical protein E6I38_01510 [Chloroflexi bacterium]|nr:MAG: hypothetical protein E6I38_01510 [Chloroflexota bacterium]